MESAYRPMLFRFVPPTASQGRRKRRWLGGKEVGQAATESLTTAAQARREGRRGAFRWFRSADRHERPQRA